MSNQEAPQEVSETFTGKPVSPAPVGSASPPFSSDPSREDATKND